MLATVARTITGTSTIDSMLCMYVVGTLLVHLRSVWLSGRHLPVCFLGPETPGPLAPAQFAPFGEIAFLGLFYDIPVRRTARVVLL